jgi:hypothetical protein
VENHEIGLNKFKDNVAEYLYSYIKSDEFLSIHPNTVEEILKFDRVKSNVSETDLLDALVRWINHHCTQNKMQLSERRQKFDNLFRLIRFPTMSNDELQSIKSKYPDLLSKLFPNTIPPKIRSDETVNLVSNCVTPVSFILS